MFAAIRLPKFPLQAVLRWRSELRARPVAVVDESSSKGTVIEATLPAEACGVCAGMPSTQAMARCTELRIFGRSPASEAAANAVLIEVSSAYSPDIEHTADGICTLDLKSAPKSMCWQKFGEDAVARLAEFELQAAVGVATNPDLALLASRNADPVNVVYRAADFLAHLPIEALNPPVEMLGILRDWGIRHIGGFLRLPRQAVIERLGPDAGLLWTLASGRSRRLLRLVRPVDVLADAHDFDYSIETSEPLLFLLRRFLDSLAARLRAAYRVAATATLTLPLEDGTSYERVFSIPSPTSDVDVLFRILTTHLENLQLPQRPVGVRLQVLPADPRDLQLHLFENPLRDPNRFGETLARLAALAGSGNAGSPQPENTHQPDQFRMVNPDFGSPDDNGNFHEPSSAAPAVGLPLRRFRPARAAQVQLQQHRPAHVESDSIRGSVIDASGPYRLSGAWWDREQWSVEEWDVDLAGAGLYRLSCTGGIWKVEGCYDLC